MGFWVLAPIPNPQSPIPNPHYFSLQIKTILNLKIKIYKIIYKILLKN
jgi:hypothetical protein